jgi:hypothetical protein
MAIEFRFSFVTAAAVLLGIPLVLLMGLVLPAASVWTSPRYAGAAWKLRHIAAHCTSWSLRFAILHEELY